jgi:predicted glycosyltransferase
VTATPRRGDPTPGATRRVLYYSNDSYGLGHIRTTLAVASELAARRPDVMQLILTGSLQAHSFTLPDNVDYVKLPTVGKGGLYSDLPTYPAPRVGYRGLWHVRAALIREAALQFAPHVVFVDWSPAGHVGELRQTLPALRAAAPRPHLVLGLPDLLTDPPEVDKEWRRLGAREILAEFYDRILIFGDRRVFDPLSEYAIPESAASRATFCGYLARPRPQRPAEHVRAELHAIARPLIVVTMGGGADGAPTIESYLSALGSGALGDVASLVVTGPLLDPAVQSALAAVAGSLPAVTLLPFTDDLGSYLNAADLVITRGGYNTAAEVLSLGKRAIILPRPGRWREQVLRAERLSALGIARALPPGEVTPAVLADTIRAALADPPPTIPLDLGGLERAAGVLDELLR